MKRIVVHAAVPSGRTFCGLDAALDATYWNQVTCKSCRRIGEADNPYRRRTTVLGIPQ